MQNSLQGISFPWIFAVKELQNLVSINRIAAENLQSLGMQYTHTHLHRPDAILQFDLIPASIQLRTLVKLILPYGNVKAPHESHQMFMSIIYSNYTATLSPLQCPSAKHWALGIYQWNVTSFRTHWPAWFLWPIIILSLRPNNFRLIGFNLVKLHSLASSIKQW